MEVWQKDLLEVLRDITQRIPGSYIDDIDRGKVIKQIDSWREQVGNVAKPNACPQLCDVNPQRKTMSIEELRNQFEYEYLRRMFSLERDENGQYIKTTTFQAWCAYKLCASLNGVLPEGFDIISKAAD